MDRIMTTADKVRVGDRYSRCDTYGKELDKGTITYVCVLDTGRISVHFTPPGRGKVVVKLLPPSQAIVVYR